ncbi:MAG: hypothetical protein GY937_16080 [bacterium]|nr:hypothetical protein [bacterium]
MSKLIAIASIVGIAVLGTACSFRGPIEDHAVAYNLAVERAQNRMLLLNVVRAFLGRPRHFTAFTQIRGSISGELSSSLSLPFGGDALNRFVASPSGSVKSSPSFDMAVLDKKEFVRGITKPITSTTFEYYWSQGWKQELLLHVFVREARLGELRLENYPASATKRYMFSEFVDQFIAMGSRFRRNEAEAYGPEVPTGQVTAEGLADAREQKLLAETVAGKLQLKTRGVGYKIECPADCVLDSFSGKEHIVPKATKEPAVEAERQWNESYATRELTSVSLGRSGAEPPEKTELRLILRSPEQMLYYLGEVARADLCDGVAPPKIRRSGSDEYTLDLFVLKRRARFREDPECTKAGFGLEDRIQSRADHDRWLEVAYEADLYWIPRVAGGRSVTAFTLVQQLIGLQKGGEELPTTSTVTVIGN